MGKRENYGTVMIVCNNIPLHKCAKNYKKAQLNKKLRCIEYALL